MSIEERTSTDDTVIITPRNKSSEVVIGLVGATGTNLSHVVNRLKVEFEKFDYSTVDVKVTDFDIFEKSDDNKYYVKTQPDGQEQDGSKAFKDIWIDMNIGDRFRQLNDDGAIAYSIAHDIFKKRKNVQSQDSERLRIVYIINSLKRPEEVKELRRVYGDGFVLIGVHADRDRRKKRLEDKVMKPHEADRLIDRDENGLEDVKGKKLEHGQAVGKTFPLSDFFVDFNKDDPSESGDSSGFVRNQIERIVYLLFGAPFLTPTFGEYAMFTAYSASLRTADLARQIGAAVTYEEEVLATGVNDVPRYGGGVYWPVVSKESHAYSDRPGGRDYTAGFDPNKREIDRIMKNILNELPENYSEESKEWEDFQQAIKASAIKDLTEYSRVVHAEMEALMMCARNHISTKGAKIYITTFPCHSCAKLMIAAGVIEVIYIEPYPKSKTQDLFPDSITTDDNNCKNKMLLTPFFGVAPTRFMQMFSMEYPNLKYRPRKYEDLDKDDIKEYEQKGIDVKLNKSDAIDWEPSKYKELRYQLPFDSYRRMERMSADILNASERTAAPKYPTEHDIGRDYGE